MSHAADRAKKYYRMELTREDLRAVSVAIAEGKPEAIHLRAENAGGNLYAVLVRGRWLGCVSTGRHITTIVPPTSLDRYRFAIQLGEARIRATNRESA